MNKIIALICFCSALIFVASCERPDLTEDLRESYREEAKSSSSVSDDDEIKDDSDVTLDEDMSDSTPDEERADDDQVEQSKTVEKECTEAGGTWNGTEKTCTRTASCDDKPANSEWNGDTTYTQKYHNRMQGNDFWSSISTEYSEEEGPCHFKCKENYFWNGTECHIECNGNYFWNGTECHNPNVECSASSDTPCQDSASNLMWSSKSSDSMTWQDAVDYCETLTEWEYNDWLLPNINELRTLIQNCHATETGGSCAVSDPDQLLYSTDECSGCIGGERGSYSKLGDGTVLWSSSLLSDDSDSAWRVDFYYGRVSNGGIGYYYYVRCVRSDRDPCDENPCSGIANSNEVCTVRGTTTYKCGCIDGYHWNGILCTNTDYLTLGNICTRQDKCYNNEEEITCPTDPSADFFGQDAQYTDKCTTQSFISSSQVVENYDTGLTWEKSLSPSEYTWEDRATHCNELNSSNYAGINTWRVPNPLELLTIVNNSRYGPATNSNFMGMPPWWESTDLWTNNEYNGDISNAYYFSPSYGNYGHVGKTETYKVLCVSGEEMKPTVSGDFVISSDNLTVTDTRTGLMWQKEVTGKNWQEALKYCEDSTYAGYSDWRLPNKNELASLVNYEKSDSPCSYFPDTFDSDFWSSSTCVDDTDLAWRVDFSYGYVLSYHKNNYINVRCVR